ncbi:hypothetical protein DEA06_10795 [Microbacterium sp. Gd 4-13]|uniref:hypothetical protein n=1 Tax=Microbacterium sp. Gd 4-13 TaxID=2173179 RepID=UPI000D57E18E|nr:hypothetical protein [Microbacterium sp. Gd 4-13]PVW03856.1 hypothetical protein DEA06_10795 [Microbacterium sp. Gd 4-13]
MMTSTRNGLGARIGVAALGIGILTALGSGAAIAATEDSVDVSVEIEPNAEPGALALTVAGESAALTETDSIGTDRVFTGTLPTVTVTDTRLAEDVDPEAFWYVLGSITDFTGDADQPDILAADAFGWAPAITAGDPALVSEGDEVLPGAPFGSGFGDDQELLALADNAAAAAPGSYSANAELTLRTPGTVAPGSYAATITLSLFEG